MKPKFKVGDMVTPIGHSQAVQIKRVFCEVGQEPIYILDATIRVMDGSNHPQDIDWLFEQMIESAVKPHASPEGRKP